MQPLVSAQYLLVEQASVLHLFRPKPGCDSLLMSRLVFVTHRTGHPRLVFGPRSPMPAFWTRTSRCSGRVFCLLQRDSKLVYGHRRRGKRACESPPQHMLGYDLSRRRRGFVRPSLDLIGGCLVAGPVHD